MRERIYTMTWRKKKNVHNDKLYILTWEYIMFTGFPITKTWLNGKVPEFLFWKVGPLSVVGKLCWTNMEFRREMVTFADVDGIILTSGKWWYSSVIIPMGLASTMMSICLSSLKYAIIWLQPYYLDFSDGSASNHFQGISSFMSFQNSSLMPWNEQTSLVSDWLQ